LVGFVNNDNDNENTTLACAHAHCLTAIWYGLLNYLIIGYTTHFQTHTHQQLQSQRYI